jgi:hypothetical protein
MLKILEGTRKISTSLNEFHTAFHKACGYTIITQILQIYLTAITSREAVGRSDNLLSFHYILNI